MYMKQILLKRKKENKYYCVKHVLITLFLYTDIRSSRKIEERVAVATVE